MESEAVAANIVYVTNRLGNEGDLCQNTVKLIEELMEFKGVTFPNGLTLPAGAVCEEMMGMNMPNGPVAAHYGSVVPPRGGDLCPAGRIARFAAVLNLGVGPSSLSYLAIE